MWLSNLFESRSRGVGLIGTFGIYLLFGFVSVGKGQQFSWNSGFQSPGGVYAAF